MEQEKLSAVGFERIKVDEVNMLHDDIREDVPVLEKRNRRRSSVFAEVRKSLLQNREANQSTSPEIEDGHSKEILVTKYIEELRREKKEWSDVTKRRKYDYEVTNKKYNDHCKKRVIMTEKECLPYLDERDKKYLRDLPNFDQIAKKYNKLRRCHKILNVDRRNNIKMSAGLLNLYRQDVEVEKLKIIEYSKIQPL